MVDWARLESVCALTGTVGSNPTPSANLECLLALPLQVGTLLKTESCSNVIGEFDRQVENLIGKGYPGVAGVTAEEFRTHVEPLKQRVREPATSKKAAEGGRIPFVIVVKSDWVASESAMPPTTRKSLGLTTVSLCSALAAATAG